jgi:hypothetical protein
LRVFHVKGKIKRDDAAPKRRIVALSGPPIESNATDGRSFAVD